MQGRENGRDGEVGEKGSNEGQIHRGCREQPERWTKKIQRKVKQSKNTQRIGQELRFEAAVTLKSSQYNLFSQMLAITKHKVQLRLMGIVSVWS